MTIKLLLLKSGEDIIADVTEMVVGEEEERTIVGYFLDKPCVIRMRDPNLIEEQGPKKQSGFQVSLFHGFLFLRIQEFLFLLIG